jgi:hypothetical protein
VGLGNAKYGPTGNRGSDSPNGATFDLIDKIFQPLLLRQTLR